MNLNEIRKNVDTLIGDLNAAKKRCKEEKRKLGKAKRNLTDIKEAQLITQQIAQTIQQQAHRRIAGVVSKGLETVFTGDDVYGFRIDFDRKRGKTEANLLLTKNGHDIDDPLNSDSGGVVDIAAFVLRLSCIILTKPKLRRFLVLDEPFKFVSEEFRENIRLLLEGLAKDFKFQFVMVTHIPELQTGKVISL